MNNNSLLKTLYSPLMFGDVRPNTVRGCPVLPQVDDGRKGRVTLIPTGLRVVIKFNLPVFKVTDKRWRWVAFPLFSSFYWHCPDWHPAEKKKKQWIFESHLTYLICIFDTFDMFTLWGSIFRLSQLILHPRSLMLYLTHEQNWQECSACMCSVTVSQTFQTLTGPPSVRVDAGHISNYLFLPGLNSPRYWS